MESDPAEKYPVVCHAVLGRRALPAAGGGGHMTKGSPELFHRSRLLEGSVKEFSQNGLQALA